MRKLLIAAILSVIILAIVNLVVPSGNTDPDAEYPMTNRNIQWHYAGK